MLGVCPTPLSTQCQLLNQALVPYWLSGYRSVKAAGAAEPTYSLSGRLVQSESGWGLLEVPNALVRGVFQAMDEPGIELPPSKGDRLNAHISVFRKEELEAIGGPGKVSEWGKRFFYQLGPIETTVPAGWDEMSRVWFIKVKSPDLMRLRRSYGLTSLPNNDRFDFHITVCVRRKGVLQRGEASKAASLLQCNKPSPVDVLVKDAAPRKPDYAMGIPDKYLYGDMGKLQAGQLLDLIIQRHEARKAGPHYDVRFGDPKGLFSFATRYEMPEPGTRRALYQQPMHSHKYKDFEGEIPSGYGAGTVKKHEEGQILITKSSPGVIHFTKATGKHPERFALVKPQGWGGKDYLLVNTTPTEPVPYEKIRYQKIPAEQVDKTIAQMQSGDSVQAKIDGASSLIKILDKGVELVSYRTAKETGRPILHTERVLHGKQTEQQMPKELVGSVLRGELYGVDPNGKAIHPSALGGLLNAGVAKSIGQQQERGIKLKNSLFDIQQMGKTPIDLSQIPYAKRREMMAQILPHLPQDVFHLSEEATTPESAKQLWEQIRSGKHPLTQEGVVIHPQVGKPQKAKLFDESDVHITGTFPGKGRRAATVGGLTYGLEPGGPTVGRIGTGFSDDFLQEIAAQNGDAFKGRVARIRAQEQLPSGAYRVPSFISFHEDYPAAAG